MPLDNAGEQSTASTATAADPAAAAADEPADCCEVCLVPPRERVRAITMRTRSLLRELCEQSGYTRLLSRKPSKHQYGQLVMHIFM